MQQGRDYFSDEALNIVYVDYPLTGDPKDRPGSARPDKDGKLWLEMNAGLSRLDPDTGDIKTWRLTNLSSNFIHEILPTPDGSVWLTLEAQGGLARFDTATEKFEVFIDQDANKKYELNKPVQKDPTIRSRTCRFPKARNRAAPAATPPRWTTRAISGFPAGR